MALSIGGSLGGNVGSQVGGLLASAIFPDRGIFSQAIGKFLGGALGNLLGGAGGLLGGAGHRGVPVGAIGIDNTEASSFLERLGLSAFRPERDFRRFRNVNAPLNAAKEEVQRAAGAVITSLRSLGFTEEANFLQTEIERANRIPSSPAGFNNQIDELLEITNIASLGVENIIGRMSNDTEFRSAFEAQTGLNFLDQFLPEFERQQNSFISTSKLPAVEKQESDELRRINAAVKRPGERVPSPSQSILATTVLKNSGLEGFKPVFKRQPRGFTGISRELIGYRKVSGGRHVQSKTINISVDEYNNRINTATQEFEKSRVGGFRSSITDLKSIIGIPQIADISSAGSSIFSLLSNTTFTDDLIDDFINPLDSADPQLPDDPTPPADPQVPGGEGTGSFDQQAEEFFNQEQRETDLITAQQQDKALQGDENATPEDKKFSALSLLGLTSSFLINSLRNTDGDSSQNTQQQTSVPSAGFSLGSSSSTPITREANVFKSGIFQPIKQTDFVRPDAPLTIIPESPSSFPLLAERGKLGLLSPGLRQQKRGLLTN